MYSFAIAGGAHANQPSRIASRNARLVTFFSWIRTAGYPSKCGIVKKDFWLRGEHRLLLAEVVDANGEDRTSGRAGIAEAPDVGLAERSLPREPLPATDHVRVP